MDQKIHPWGVIWGPYFPPPVDIFFKKNPGKCSVHLYSSPWARSADSLSDHQIKKDIAELLNKFTGRNDVSEPDNLYRNCWSQDKFSFGSYSASSLKMSKETFKKTSEPLPSKTKPKLLFAGEGTHWKFWSFLHGARESGLREANRILQKINE